MCQERNEIHPETVARTGARRRPLVLGTALGTVGLLLSLLPVTSRLEETLGLKLLFTVRGPLPPSTQVVVVGVSRDAARAVGQTTELDTWPRDLHAQLLERLSAGERARSRST